MPDLTAQIQLMPGQRESHLKRTFPSPPIILPSRYPISVLIIPAGPIARIGLQVIAFNNESKPIDERSAGV
ncbi:hypothetical protein [Stieleria mannarensis]|uniref:hypothetical protein n=1 Tax=Stieleria mannarensis TaxID=2755585 RepID=UPI0015FF2B11|nr:hypothetical protein [Rhodopirellula sp. JC639]